MHPGSKHILAAVRKNLNKALTALIHFLQDNNSTYFTEWL